MQLAGDSSAAVPRFGRVSAACAVFAGLAVVGSMFGTLYRASMTFGDGSMEIEAHSWSHDVELGVQQTGPKMGYPLIFAVLMLFGAAVLSRLAPTIRAAGVVTAAGTAFLTGVVWSIGMQLATFVSGLREIEALDEQTVVEWAVGPGLGLLLLATAFAIAATVVAFLPARRRNEPDDPYQEDIPTPRHGFPMPDPGDAHLG